MGNYANCCEKNHNDLPDNVNKGDMADSAKRPKDRNKIQNGGTVH